MPRPLSGVTMSGRYCQRFTSHGAEYRANRLPCFRITQAIAEGTLEQARLGIGDGLAGIPQLTGSVEQLGVARSLRCAVFQVIKGALGQW